MVSSNSDSSYIAVSVCVDFELQSEDLKVHPAQHAAFWDVVFRPLPWEQQRLPFSLQLHASPSRFLCVVILENRRKKEDEDGVLGKEEIEP